jgi:hypothetical protein
MRPDYAIFYDLGMKYGGTEFTTAWYMNSYSFPWWHCIFPSLCSLLDCTDRTDSRFRFRCCFLLALWFVHRSGGAFHFRGAFSEARVMIE